MFGWGEEGNTRYAPRCPWGGSGKTPFEIPIHAHALILSVLGRGRAAQFLRDMQESHTAVLRVRASDEERAKQILFQYTDKDFSFADATSFTVMERVGIRLAFTFDRDFTQYGLTALSA